MELKGDYIEEKYPSDDDTKNRNAFVVLYIVVVADNPVTAPTVQMIGLNIYSSLGVEGQVSRSVKSLFQTQEIKKLQHYSSSWNVWRYQQIHGLLG